MRRFTFMKTIGVACLVCGVLGFAHICLAQGSSKLVLRIATNSFRGPLEPLDRTFRVQGDYPPSFVVTVTNTDSSAQAFYENASSGGYSSISFEITDENGNSNVVRKKRDPSASTTVTSSYLQPQEKREFDILIDPDIWENSYKLQKQGARKLRVRAVYDNNGSTIYSEYYDLEVVGSSSSSGTQESSKDNASSASSVLVSK